MVRLYRNTSTGTPSEGIYQCLVENDTFTKQTIDIGLYNSGGGIYNNNYYDANTHFFLFQVISPSLVP